MLTSNETYTQDATENNKQIYEEMKAILHMCTQISGNAEFKSVCFQILPMKWLSKPFLAVVFANSNLPKQKFCAFFLEEDLLEVLDQ